MSFSHGEIPSTPIDLESEVKPPQQKYGVFGKHRMYFSERHTVYVGIVQRGKSRFFPRINRTGNCNSRYVPAKSERNNLRNEFIGCGAGEVEERGEVREVRRGDSSQIITPQN